MVPLKYHLINIWKMLKTPLINCENILILTWSANYIIVPNNQVATFAITDTKLYAPVVTFSTQENVKLLQQLKSKVSLEEIK